jgi:hypothetical protein
MELATQLDMTMGLDSNCILVRPDRYEIAIEDSASPIHERDGQAPPLSNEVLAF